MGQHFTVFNKSLFNFGDGEKKCHLLTGKENGQKGRKPAQFYTQLVYKVEHKLFVWAVWAAEGSNEEKVILSSFWEAKKN